MDDLREQREKLGVAVGKLEDVQALLRQARESLPHSPADLSPEDMEEPSDPASELRALIDCALREGLAPPLQPLRQSAALPHATERSTR